MPRRKRHAVWRVRRRWAVRLFIAAAVTVHALTSPAALALEAIVPAYFYPSPGSPWEDLNDAAMRIPLTAIMNPASGPGGGVNGDYVDAVNDLRAAGGRVIGYVSTSWAARPIGNVIDDVDDYLDWYDLDGIFFDEMTNSASPYNLNYYQTLYGHVKSLDPSLIVVGNPGTNTDEEYLSTFAADHLIVFEGQGSSYPGYSPSLWNFNHDASSFGHLIHNVSSSAAMQQDLDLAVSRNAGMVFITDDTTPNPWDTLPAYWDEQVDAIEQINNVLPVGVAGLATHYHHVANGAINIDASRSDWTDIPAYIDDESDSAGPQVDYTGLQIAHDDTHLYFRFTLDASEPLSFRHNVLIDADLNAGTGFIGSGAQLPIGADLLLQAAGLWQFNSGSPTTWGWSFIESGESDDDPATDVEISISREALGNPEAIDLVVFGDNTTTADYYPNDADGGAPDAFFRYLFVEPLTGDFNGDGKVDLDDYDILSGNYHQIVQASINDGDATFDGVVTFEDFVHLALNFGADVTSPLPEPSSAALLLIALSLLHRRGPHQRAVTPPRLSSTCR